MPTIPLIAATEATREAVLGNPKFHGRLRLNSAGVELDVLRLAWLTLTDAQRTILVVMYSLPGIIRSYDEAAAQLSNTVLTVQTGERRALRIIREFYERPHSWARLEAVVRNFLLDFELRHPGQLTEEVVVDLLTGQLGDWGPKYSAALNAALARLGERRLLQDRLPRGFLGSAHPAVRRRLGELVPDTLTNRAFVLMVAADGDLPDLRALMVVWKQLTFSQRTAMSRLYPDQRAPGPILRMQVADQMGINPETLTRHEQAAVAALRRQVTVLRVAKPGWA